jgi:hypothetical protein
MALSPKIYLLLDFKVDGRVDIDANKLSPFYKKVV